MTIRRIVRRAADTAASGSRALSTRHEQDWRNGTLLILAITVLPIVVLALVLALHSALQG